MTKEEKAKSSDKSKRCNPRQIKIQKGVDRGSEGGPTHIHTQSLNMGIEDKGFVHSKRINYITWD